MRLLAEDQFKCSLCNEVFHDPVDTPCGHCYCKLCITSHWTEPTEEGDYKCPQCSRAYSTRPELYSNGVVKKMLERARYSPVLPASAYARPGDVACDFCTGRKLKAVKFCLTCIAAYCESHFKQQHIQVPVLRRHRCIEPSDSKELEKHLCLKHCKALDVFCKTDQSHICSLCALLEHKSHDIEIADSEKKVWKENKKRIISALFRCYKFIHVHIVYLYLFTLFILSPPCYYQTLKQVSTRMIFTDHPLKALLFHR